MKGYLLDIELLLALFSQDHAHYEQVSEWFAQNANGGWATCSLSDIEYAKIFSAPSYSTSPVSINDAISLLKKAKQLPNYSYWTTPFNCLTSPEYSDIFAKTRSPELLQGAYLVAIAKYNNGLLATLNKTLANTYPQYTELVCSL